MHSERHNILAFITKHDPYKG